MRQESFQVLITPQYLVCKNLQVHILIYNSQGPVTINKHHLCVLGHFGPDFYTE